MNDNSEDQTPADVIQAEFLENAISFEIAVVRLLTEICNGVWATWSAADEINDLLTAQRDNKGSVKH